MSEQELKPCPFCGGAARLKSNRDWHRIIVDHDEECVFLDQEVSMVPATDEQLGFSIADWNRRAVPSAPAPAPAERPTDAMLDDMRKRGLSIDGDNAYKRDLLDAVVGAMAFGKQRSAKPPAGHWLEEFYEIGEAEADERDQLRAEVEALRKDAERLDFMIDERAVIQELLALDGPRFTLTWTESGEFQKHVYGTPREAIDAAMAAKEG